jgi:hypothetical protein
LKAPFLYLEERRKRKEREKYLASLSPEDRKAEIDREARRVEEELQAQKVYGRGAQKRKDKEDDNKSVQNYKVPSLLLIQHECPLLVMSVFCVSWC